MSPWWGAGNIVRGLGTDWDLLREALDQKEFDIAWAEGAQLSTEEAIAYAQRGRGERKRPTGSSPSINRSSISSIVCTAYS